VVKDELNLKSETVKEIINETSSFNIPLIVKRTVNIVVSDNGTDQFPCVVNVHSSKMKVDCAINHNNLKGYDGSIPSFDEMRNYHINVNTDKN